MYQNFLHLKKNKKTQCLTPCFDIKNLRIYFSVFWGSLGVYIKKVGLFLANEAGANGGLFSEVPSNRKEISTIGLHTQLLGNYMSLHSKIEMADLNIYRDIIKVLLVTGSLSEFYAFLL